MSDSKIEPRFIFYTTNVLLLALAELPLVILSWGITASKMVSKTITSDLEDIILELLVSRRVRSKKFEDKYPSLMEKLPSIPEGFSPYLTRLVMNTVSKGEDRLECIMFSIKSEDYPDNPWIEIEKIDDKISKLKKGIDKKQEEIAQIQKDIQRQPLKPYSDNSGEEIKKIEKQISRRKKNVAKKQVKIAQLQENQLQLKKNAPRDDILSDIYKVWKMGEYHIGELEDKERIISYYPKMRRKNILVLVSVNGSEAKARELPYLTELRDEMILQGNAYAQTPICDVVGSVLEDRKRLIFRKLKRE